MRELHTCTAAGHRYQIAKSKMGSSHSKETREKIARAVSSTKQMLRKQRLAHRAAVAAEAATADLRPSLAAGGIVAREDVEDGRMSHDGDVLDSTIELEKAVIEMNVLRNQLTNWMKAYEKKYGKKPDLTETSESHPHVYGRFVRFVAYKELVRRTSLKLGQSPVSWE